MIGSPIKWVGSKRAEAATIVPVLVDFFERHPDALYFEPFLGGGSVFFGLAEALNRRPQLTSRAWAALSDCQGSLAGFFRTLKYARADLLDALKVCKLLPETDEAFRALRDLEVEGDLLDAARFYYVNKTGFNGLWRVNADNRCNVSWGKHGFPSPDAEAFKEWSEFLAGASIDAADYRASALSIYERMGISCDTPAAIFVDPPYPKTFEGWTNGETVEPAELIAFLDSAVHMVVGEALVLLTVPEGEPYESLCKDWTMSVPLPRVSVVSCKASGRKDIGQVLWILNREGKS